MWEKSALMAAVVGGTRKRRKRHERVLEPDIRTVVRLSLGTARHEADSGRSVVARLSS